MGSGSTSIKLSDISLKLDSQTGSQTLNYGLTSTKSTYSVTYISNGGKGVSNEYLSTGDLIQISFINQNNIVQGQTATLKLLTKNGVVKPVDMTMPSAMTKETTYLFP